MSAINVAFTLEMAKVSQQRQAVRASFSDNELALRREREERKRLAKEAAKADIEAARLKATSSSSSSASTASVTTMSNISAPRIIMMPATASAEHDDDH